jgi:diaminopropionate ammonia-lyase
MQAFINESVRRDAQFAGLFDADDYRDVKAFYGAHLELNTTPLRSLAGLASELGIGTLLVKDESHRFGVEAFKITGAQYAIDQLGRARVGRGLVCATAGNHGRAVARVAMERGTRCTVFLPAADPDAHPIERETRATRVAAMRADGADVVESGGSYEEAVAQAAEYAEKSGATIVSDTSWPGYDAIPRSIMAGYTHVLEEARQQWDALPDVVFVQAGVGGLVCASASWFAFHYRERRPFLIACEPDSAACLLESARTGRIVHLSESHASPGRVAGVNPTGEGGRAPIARTMMAGLRCQEPSPAAWPTIQSGIDAFMSIPDEYAVEAIGRLARSPPGDPAIAAGPSGACGVASLIALTREAAFAQLGRSCALNRSTRAMVIVTEGP